MTIRMFKIGEGIHTEVIVQIESKKGCKNYKVTATNFGLSLLGAKVPCTIVEHNPQKEKPNKDLKLGLKQSKKLLKKGKKK